MHPANQSQLNKEYPLPPKSLRVVLISNHNKTNLQAVFPASIFSIFDRRISSSVRYRSGVDIFSWSEINGNYK